MKQIIVFSLVLISALLLAGCGNKPQTTANKFFRAMEKNDFESARQYVSKDSQNEMEAIREMFEKMSAAEKESYTNLKFTIDDIVIDGDTAIVTYKEGSDWKNGTDTTEKPASKELKMLTENGEWKVVMTIEVIK